MKIYVAAPYPIRDEAIIVMQNLEAAGHEVTSRWLKSPDEMTDEYARQDLEDVASADLLLALNPKEWRNQGTGGRHVEFGAAITLEKRIIIIGVRSNIFHHFEHVDLVETVEEALSLMSAFPLVAPNVTYFTRPNA